MVLICPIMGNDMKALECIKENCTLFISEDNACAFRSISVSLKLINESINTFREEYVRRHQYAQETKIRAW